MQKLLLTASALLLSACQAQAAPPAPASGGAPAKNPDMSGFAAEVDTNHDGKMSREEWAKAGLPFSSFNGFERGRGYVTLADYQTNPAPKGIDLNGDGILTVAEFKAFDAQMAGKQPPPRP